MPQGRGPVAPGIPVPGAEAAAPPAGEKPLRRDAERNRQRILTAAREVFAARGVDVTLDDIAHHAGLGVGTVYRRFPSREHLVEALFEDRLAQVVGWAEQGLQNPDPWDGLQAFIWRCAEATATDRGLQDVMVSRAYGHEHVDKAKAKLVPVVEALVARAQASGVLRAGIEGSDLALVQFMIGSVVEYTEHFEAGLWQRYLALMLAGLRATPDPSEALPHPAPDLHTLDCIAEKWKPPRRSGTPTG
jgi:AcrR family transcriptional regulator